MAIDTYRSSGVCAIVVSYFPDTGFERRLQQLSSQVDALVVVDNTVGDRSSRDAVRAIVERNAYWLIENSQNEGIATALNQGLFYASEKGFQWALTMDQDSECQPDIVMSLLAVAELCKTPVLVGSNYFDANYGRPFVEPTGRGEFLEQVTVITSGNLIPVEFSRAIGGFRDDYFIDQVDHEFCLRARSHGAQVVITRRVVMAHSVGSTGGVHVPWLGTFPEHGPLRKYYIARNTLVTISRYWRQQPRWCFRRLSRLCAGLLAMLLLEKQGLIKARAFCVGVFDFFRGALGPCQRKWLSGN